MNDELPRPGRRAALAAGATLALLGAAGDLRAEAADGLRLGVVPYFSPSRLEEIYAPAAADLARALGRNVGFRTTATWDRFYVQLREQAYDIVLVHALWYVPAVDEFGYLPLARARESFTSVVVVRESSPVRVPADLKGRVVATPPVYLPAVHLAKKALRDQGLVRGRDLRFEETRTVDACLQQALTGAADACVAPPFAANAYQAKNAVRLRVVLESQALPSIVFLVHRRVPAADRDRLRAAMLAWGDSAEGRAILKNISTQGMVPAVDKEYDAVRAFVRQLDEPWRPSAP